ncbi:unnamed protein product [Prunus armeniaca]
MQYPKNEKQSNQEEPPVDEYRMHKDLSSFKQEEPNQSIYCLTKPEINSQNLRLGPKNRTLLPKKIHDRIASSFPSTEDRNINEAFEST